MENNLEITKKHYEVLNGKRCPYCGKETKHVDSIEIYGTSYGMIYLCEPCNAYVGCHKKDQTKALGRLANWELRELKKEAHWHFDRIWEEKFMDRKEAYQMLSERFDIPKDLTHIGMFDIEMCKEVIEWSKETYKLLNKCIK